jgi:hypothetical protein
MIGLLRCVISPGLAQAIHPSSFTPLASVHTCLPSFDDNSSRVASFPYSPLSVRLCASLNTAMDPCGVDEVKDDIEFYIEANEGMEGGDDMDPYEVSARQSTKPGFKMGAGLLLLEWCLEFEAIFTCLNNFKAWEVACG